MTSADYIVLDFFVLLLLSGLIALPALCQWGIRWLHRSWRNSHGGGCAYHPLQEMIQPQIRHVVEAKEQRPVEDGAGAPPDEL